MEISKKLTELINKQGKLEQEIWDIISELPNFSGECNCKHKDKDNESIDLVHYGEWKEIMTYCLKCGGLM